MGYGFAGSISPKAAKKLNGKLAVLRGTRAQRGKMAAFEAKEKDEGKTAQRAEIPSREINHPTNQAKKGVGAVSKGGGIGKAESQERSAHIDAPRNAKTFPAGGKSSGRAGGTPSAAKGPIAPSGGPYGGGGRNTQ